MDDDKVLAAIGSAGIYAIVNTTNGRRYIGSSIDIRKRYADHRQALRAGKHHNGHLQHAWAKYGEARFALLVLEIVTNPKDLCRVEQRYLDSGMNLYNSAVFADRPSMLGKKHSAETKAKIGAANSVALKGNKIPPEVTAKRVAKVLGQRRSEETKSKMRAAQSGHTPVNAIIRSAELRRGKPLPVEHRQKISASMKGRERTLEHCANLSASQKGKKKSAAAVSAMTAGRWTLEARARASLMLKGKIPVEALAARKAQTQQQRKGAAL